MDDAHRKMIETRKRLGPKYPRPKETGGAPPSFGTGKQTGKPKGHGTRPTTPAP